MRIRLEILGAILAAGGVVFAVQQAMSVPGTWLAAGLYITIAGVVVMVLSSRQPGGSRMTGWAWLVTVLASLVALALGLFAIGFCGVTVLVFECRA